MKEKSSHGLRQKEGTVYGENVWNYKSKAGKF